MGCGEQADHGRAQHPKPGTHHTTRSNHPAATDKGQPKLSKTHHNQKQAIQTPNHQNTLLNTRPRRLPSPQTTKI